LAGEFDPRTPPEYARVVAAGLTQARVLEIPWHGHEYALECVNRIERDFFNAPRGVPASGCLDSLPPLRFVSGVTLGGWTSSIALRAAASPLPVASLAGVALLLFVPATWVSAVEVRARSGVPEVRRRESLALLLAALAGLVFVFATAGALLAGSRKGVMVPALGVPDEWKWVLALPWVLGAAGLVVAGVSFNRLRTGERTSTLRAACLLIGIVLLLGTSLAA
jgi:hypothetical protein